MNDEQIYFQVLLRSPKYPVLVIDGEDLWTAFNVNELGTACYFSIPPENSDMIPVIDSSGEEFLYFTEKISLMPGISRKKWTKKKIIDLFNDSFTAKERNMKYSSKSISNKKLCDIICEICTMIATTTA